MISERDSELIDYFRKLSENAEYWETHCEYCGEVAGKCECENKKEVT